MEKKVKILLCEDDENLGMLLKEYLKEKGFEIDLFHDGEEGYKALLKRKYDLCLLDLMMPKKDGLSLAHDIKILNIKTPIVFLTGKTLKEDVINGFKNGADDYITKPFSIEELLLRIEAIIRRTKGKYENTPIVYKIGKYSFNSQKQELMFDDKINKLTAKESELLTLLVSYSNSILDRSFALKTIWGEDNFFNARSMDVYIAKLRKILNKDMEVRIINVHGRGYKLVFP